MLELLFFFLNIYDSRLPDFFLFPVPIFSSTHHDPIPQRPSIFCCMKEIHDSHTLDLPLPRIPRLFCSLDLLLPSLTHRPLGACSDEWIVFVDPELNI